MTRTLSRIRTARLTSTGTEAPRLEISSLVDVAFLLLTFFLLTATLDPREADLGMRFDIPKPGTKPVNPFIPDTVRIDIKSDGSVWCNGDALEPAASSGASQLPALLARLRDENAFTAMLSQQPVTRVEISAADAVPGQRLMDVMSCVAESGITEVSLAGFVE